MSNDASVVEHALPVTTAEANRLFGPLANVPVLILAVSGGPDSTALMVLAARWRATCKQEPKLVAVTVDHGLRSQAKREAAAVARLARQLGIAHRTLRWTGRKPKTGVQEAARLARYQLLAEAARKAGARCVLAAHTLDDQAETVLFRLARGSGVGGLAGMEHVGRMPVAEGRGIALVRPLLGIPKARLIATLKAARIAYADDPTNRDPRFTRPRLRTLMPALAQEGLTAARLGTLARRARQVEETLFEVVRAARSRFVPGEWPLGGPVTIQAAAFDDLPLEIAQRLLGQAIAWTGDEGPVELGKLETLHSGLLGAFQDRTKFRRTLAGAIVTLAGDRITVERAPPRSARRQNRLTTPSRGRPKRSKPR